MPRRRVAFSLDETADRLIPIAHVAALLSVDQKSIRRWVARGQFPVPLRLVGNAMRWRKSAVDSWIADREKNNGQQHNVL